MTRQRRPPPPLPKQDHAWGHSWLLHRDDTSALFRFQGTRGGASSLHRHAGKTNSFFVVEGRLEIRSNDGMKHTIFPGQWFFVPAGMWHRMIFLQDTVGYEFYTSQGETLSLEDIERIEPGWTPEAAQFMEWKA
jgi:quercetin dioxygenase-like cupin family protein